MSFAFSDQFLLPAHLVSCGTLYLQSQICLDRRILLCLRLFFANGRPVVAVVFSRTLAKVSCRVLFASEGPPSHVNGYLVLSHHVKRLLRWHYDQLLCKHPSFSNFYCPHFSLVTSKSELNPKYLFLVKIIFVGLDQVWKKWIIWTYIKSPCVPALFFQISRLWLAMSLTVLWSDQDHAET